MVSKVFSVSFSPRVITILLIATLFLVACGKEREEAQDFQVTLFNGSQFHLADQIGKNAVVLNFWYPSCPPCRAEMPAFEEAWQAVKGEDVRFLGLFVPQGLDSEQDARDFVAELGLTYDFATDVRSEQAKAYQIAYFPTTYFIDQEGKVFSAEISVLDTQKITRLVRDMLEG